MGEREDNEVPKGGYWSYSNWLFVIIPGGAMYGIFAWLKQGGNLPF